jgi:stage III sporulation protein SpoIIIAA
MIQNPNDETFSSTEPAAPEATATMIVDAPEPYEITDNLDELLAILPPELARSISADERARLIEIVLDLGRQPDARFAPLLDENGQPERSSTHKYLRAAPVTADELKFVESKLGTFGDDNRAGLPATLHRISAIRNRRGVVVGLTLRVGRAVSGIVDILRDLIASGQSVLLMGRPGLGKTTLLREMARVLADEEERRVVIVDTSNEIAGDGDVPHPAIGRARRMQVARVGLQHDVMIEAVENHMPEVVVIDEIGRTEEALAARTIAERGVQLIATVHGNTLDNLLLNPSMSDLIGGIGSVTLSDEEARRRGTQKTVLERKAPPTFDVVVEIVERGRITVRRPVAEFVDALLRGQPLAPETRRRDDEGRIHIEAAPEEEAQHEGFDMRPRHASSRDSEAPDRRARSNRSRDERPERNSRSRHERSPERAPERGEARARGGESAASTWAGSAASKPASKLTPRLIQPSPRPRDAASGDGESERTGLAVLDEDADDLGVTSEAVGGEEVEDEDEGDSFATGVFNAARVKRLYPFGVSRSRLTRAIKQLGLEIVLSRSWHDSDAVLMLSGGGVTSSSSLLREARELQLPIVSVRGNTYAQILARLNDLFADVLQGDATLSARDLAVIEARHAAQRVLGGGEPVDLRPQSKTMRRLQHQVAEKFHLRSYSVGREPHRRVRLLPAVRRVGG